MAQPVTHAEAWNERLRLDLPEIVLLPPKLYPIITRFNEFDAFLLEGGRGSGKSHSVARFLLWLGEQRKLRIVCGREIQANIEESVFALLKDLVNQYGLNYEIKTTPGRERLIHRISGTEFRFKGFREQGNVSIKGLEGCDILWIDEAQSITKPTLDIIEPTIRKDNAKLFFTMNRFMRDDAVFEAYSRNRRCLHITVNYFENPFCPLSLKIQAEEKKLKNERDYNHIWLGHPLAQADDYIFNFDKLAAANTNKPFGEIFGRQRVLGIDFAAQGNDSCVATILDRLSPMHWGVTEQRSWQQADTMQSVGKIVEMIGKLKPDLTVIDIGGMGKVVFDRLNEVFAGTNVKIFAFDGGSTDGVDTNHYGNKRAAGYFLLVDWFDASFLCIDDQHKEVLRQLEKIKGEFRSNGVRFIQMKAKMKKAIGYSPDEADSLMMAVWGAVHFLGKPANDVASQTTASHVRRKTGSDRSGGKSRR